MKKIIIIVGGDPNSINSEIIYKTWNKLNKKLKKKTYIIANHNLIRDQFKKLNYSLNVVKTKDLNVNNSSIKLKIIDIPLNFKNPFNVSAKNSSKYVKKSLSLAHKLAKNKWVLGLINCPINKILLNKSGKIGVTEFLSNKCGIKNRSEVMMIFNKKLSVVPLTTHIDIKEVSKNINRNIILKKIFTLNDHYKKYFNKKPKLGILGLNPHNAEFRKNSEEIKKIIPAIKKLKKKGVSITGPISTDTAFMNVSKSFDVIIGMYHDQVLAPFKTLFNFDAINITLGLKYIRVSPDHGPAIDIILKKKANFLSLLKCVKFINSLNK